MAMIRRCVAITDEQRDFLRQLAQARGVTVSELIRDLIDRERAQVERPAKVEPAWHDRTRWR